MKKLFTLLLALCLLLSCAACGAAEPESTAEPTPTEEPLPVLSVPYSVERNEGSNAVSYPYVVHTATANWYLSAADLELLGEEAYFEGLELLLRDQDADFADAQAVLRPWLQEEIPPVDIYTDFCGHAEQSEMYGAFYSEGLGGIRLFHDWGMAAYSLLHEYVHYLTFTCAVTPIQVGFYADSVAEYVSRFACPNRMARLTASHMTEEERGYAREYGVWDEELDCLDQARYYLLNAEALRSDQAVGHQFQTIYNAVMTRTEKMQTAPGYHNISYYEAGSIMAYLVETYGAELAFSDWGGSPGEMEAVFGKSFDEIYTDWAVWNTEKCRELGINPDGYLGE